MDSTFIILLACLIPFVLSRQLSSVAVIELPDEKKLELINVSAKGRMYLWFWLLPIIVVAIFFKQLLWPLLIIMVIAMVGVNQWWVRSRNFPATYIRKHLYAGLLMITAVIAPMITYMVIGIYAA